MMDITELAPASTRADTAVQPHKKRCLNCNKWFGRRVLANGKLEWPNNFKKKRCCSHICAGIYTEAQKKLARDARQL